MELATSGLFRAKWTNAIHDEWTRSVLRGRPDLRPEQLGRTRELMNRAVADCLVEGYEELISGLQLPDPNDRHVLGAAIRCGADVIVTFNIKDFPPEVLNRYEIEAQHPDTFLQHQLGLDDAKVVIAAQRCRKRLRNPPYTVEQYLEAMERQSLPQTVAELRRYAAVL